jgi:hypothetical protein
LSIDQGLGEDRNSNWGERKRKVRLIYRKILFRNSCRRKGHIRMRLKRRYVFLSYIYPCSFPSFTLFRVRWYLKNELMVGIGNHEIGRKAGRPEETE